MAEEIFLQANSGSVAAIQKLLTSYARAMITTLKELKSNDNTGDVVEEAMEQEETLATAIEEPTPETLASKERRAILEALNRNNGNKMATARELRINVKTLYNKLKTYGHIPQRRPLPTFKNWIPDRGHQT